LGCAASQLDVSSPQSIQQLAESLKNKKLDLLLNVAGIMSPPENDGLQTVNMAVLEKTFAVNTFGPLLLTQALLPNLLKSENPRLGFMSSRVGSIADNSSGGSYAYRSSKTALNSICKSMAMDLRDKGVIVVIMHPGFTKVRGALWVNVQCSDQGDQTGLDPKVHEMKEAVEPEEAAKKLWKVLMSKKLEESGMFWHREGQELPW
jgi:NAD(P)-dependent dehydrogenase (short-subunit alcohol dehydrogenase family)